MSELIPPTKKITSETLPKPLSAVPCIIENTSRSWLIAMSFQGAAPPQEPPTHQKSLMYDFRITMVRQLEMKRRKEEIILRKKL